MKKFPFFLVILLLLFVGFAGHKMWKNWKKTAPGSHKVVVSEHKPFVILIPSYNNIKWCERNLRSALDQDYDNFRIIYIDDCSTDGTGAKVEKMSEAAKKVSYFRNTANMGLMANLYFAIHSCSDDEVVVIVDGDDWLAHDHVLSRLNEIYADPQIWLTYGSYVEYPSYKKGIWARPYAEKVIRENKFRTSSWGASHLRTFYAGLFKKVALNDFLYEGKFYDVSADLATMFPMLELAGHHSKYLSDVLYIYNRDNPISDDKIRFKRQSMLGQYISKLPCYKPLATLNAEAVQEKTADLVVFSYDRPMQLLAFLESVDRYVSGLGSTTVIYRTSDSSYEKEYNALKGAFPEVRFVKQSADNFKSLVMEASFQTPSKYVVFGVDDIILKGEIDLAECISSMEKTGAYGFYLRLGKNTDYCYMLDQSQPIPPSIEVENGIYAWQFGAGIHDWKYPNTLDFTVYRKEEIRPTLEKIKFMHPNDFESQWAHRSNDKKIGLYYEDSKLVNLPLNLVHLSSNRHSKSFSAEELLKKFQAGLKIDISPLHHFNNTSPHIDFDVEFTSR